VAPGGGPRGVGVLGSLVSPAIVFGDEKRKAEAGVNVISTSTIEAVAANVVLKVARKHAKTRFLNRDATRQPRILSFNTTLFLHHSKSRLNSSHTGISISNLAALNRNTNTKQFFN